MDLTYVITFKCLAVSKCLIHLDGTSTENGDINVFFLWILEFRPPLNTICGLLICQKAVELESTFTSTNKTKSRKSLNVCLKIGLSLFKSSSINVVASEATVFWPACSVHDTFGS